MLNWKLLPKDSGIYAIKNEFNNKLYIGQSISIQTRCKEHCQVLKQGKSKNLHLQAAWNKYGPLVFSFLLIELCELEKLDECEIFWIKAYKVCDRKYGYNIEEFPSGTGKRSPETRKCLRERNSHYWKDKKFTEEHKQKIREALKDVPKPPRTIEHIKNLIIAQNARWTEETRKKRSDSQYRKWQDSAYRKHIIESHSHPRGPMSEETKEKIRKGHLRRKSLVRDHQEGK